MDKINFQNLPNQTTPINASNLNQLQTNVENAINTKQDAMTSGTWTPTIAVDSGTAPTVTYTTRRGSYKKIGNMVFISFYIRGSITALNATNNFARIGGLPFSTKEGTIGEMAISTGTIYNCLQNTDETELCPYGPYILLQHYHGSAATTWKVTPSGGYFEIAGSGWYETE